MNKQTQSLQHILDNAIDHKKIFGTSFCVRHGESTWNIASGNMDINQQYFIASTTKLFVTAIVMHYRSIDLLSLDDKIDKYLGQDVIMGLHRLNGKDYSGEITIKNLLAHTSGIPDYFQQKDNKGDSLENVLMGGLDEKWTFEQAVERSKGLKPLFAPDAKNKAHYSDTNFQLLGRIIEIVSGECFGKVCQELICRPLGLSKTYLYTDIQDTRPKPLYYKNREFPIPNAMASFGADGGIVATSGEMMVFLEAFFTGRLFPKAYLNELKVWNRIYFPMRSGIGLQCFKLPWIFNPLGTIPDMIGHSGLSGALAFSNPEKDLYITGTVNQVAHPDASFRLMIKLIQEALKPVTSIED